VALNELSVAQAAKEETDKLSARAKMYGIPSDSVQFSGCSQPAYPSFSGASLVKNIEGNRISLTSGQTILIGDCTEGKGYAEGDLLQF
jgi:hypothetical protein